jgi:hypothetical protein
MGRFLLGMKENELGMFEFTTFDRWSTTRPDDKSLYINVDNDAELDVAVALITESKFGWTPRLNAAYIEAAMTVYRKSHPLGTCYIHPRFR